MVATDLSIVLMATKLFVDLLEVSPIAFLVGQSVDRMLVSLCINKLVLVVVGFGRQTYQIHAFVLFSQ